MVNQELSVQEVDAFHERGLLRLANGFDSDKANQLTEGLWNKLRTFGIEENQPGTWQDLSDKQLREAIKRTRKFKGLQAIYSNRVENAALDLAADDELERQSPLLLLTFSGTHDHLENTAVPRTMWHTDAPGLPDKAPAAIIVLGFLNRVEPRGGGTMVVAGSHRLHGESANGVPSRMIKRRLRKHDYFKALFSKSESNREHLLEKSQNVNGVEVQVVELTGDPGDVYLLNSALLHTITRNFLTVPRFMVRGFYGTEKLTSYYTRSIEEKRKLREESP